MRRNGHTLLEFAIAVSVFALLLAVLLDKLGLYQQTGEQAAIKALQINLRAALAGQVATLQARGREHEIATLAGANPVQWLQRPPAGYAGELSAAQAAGLAAGSWYFDPLAHHLVYVRRGQETSLNNAAGNICFRVELQRLPSKIANAESMPAPQTELELIEVNDCRTPPLSAATRR